MFLRIFHRCHLRYFLAGIDASLMWKISRPPGPGILISGFRRPHRARPCCRLRPRQRHLIREEKMSRKLKRTIALVTGGGAGISLWAAKRFAEEGARGFITSRRQTELGGVSVPAADRDHRRHPLICQGLR